MPDTRPRIVFDETGQCNACSYHERKSGTDWDARAEEFAAVCKRLKAHPVYDCIVPFSGGKDSASIAYRLKQTHGLRPLLVCYGQLLWTDVGRYNLHRVADSGFDILYWRCNQEVSRTLARRFLIERGHPKLAYDSAVNAVPLITAVNFGIPLVLFAEHGETEYGGLVLSEDHRRRRDLNEVLENQVGDDARNWATDGLTEADLYPYIYPDLADVDRVGVEAHYFSYYFPWDIYENAKLAREKMGFRQATNQHIWKERNGVVWSELPPPFVPIWWGKSDGSFEGYDSIDDKIDDLDYYLMHIKFGFGRATRQASRLIQYGHMTREQGLQLVRMHDGEFPEAYLDDVLDYVRMERAELDDVIERHRNRKIWHQKDGQWTLRNPPQ